MYKTFCDDTRRWYKAVFACPCTNFLSKENIPLQLFSNYPIFSGSKHLWRKYRKMDYIGLWLYANGSKYNLAERRNSLDVRVSFMTKHLKVGKRRLIPQIYLVITILCLNGITWTKNIIQRNSIRFLILILVVRVSFMTKHLKVGKRRTASNTFVS